MEKRLWVMMIPGPPLASSACSVLCGLHDVVPVFSVDHSSSSDRIFNLDGNEIFDICS